MIGDQPATKCARCIAMHHHVLHDGPFTFAILLEELGLPYTAMPVPLSDVKTPYLFPNGRLPSLYDRNTALTLWESGAILEYLAERHDGATYAVTFPSGSSEAAFVKQYFLFQASG